MYSTKPTNKRECARPVLPKKNKTENFRNFRKKYFLYDVSLSDNNLYKMGMLLLVVQKVPCGTGVCA